MSSQFNPFAVSDGYARRFERRPEFRLFGRLVGRTIIDAPVRERAVDDLKVIRIEDVFAGTEEIFLGFGRPNAYLVCPDTAGGYQKYAGKSLKRAPSKVENTRGFVQSGILIRFKGLPPEAAERLRVAMGELDGLKFWTCVNACTTVLERAGFSSGAKPLGQYYFPYDLFRALDEVGLFFQGKPVRFEFIRTTPDSVQRYTLSIIKAELLTLCRHADRSVDAVAKKNRLVAALRTGWQWLVGLFFAILMLPARLCGWKQSHGRAKPGPVAPELPRHPSYAGDLRLRISLSSTLGSVLRQLWGPHALFEVQQSRVDPGAFLTGTLSAFPQSNPSLATRLKKWVLFSPLVVRAIRWGLCPRFQEFGCATEPDIYDMLRTDSEQSPNKYNLVVTARGITISRINVGVKLVDWLLSKHVLMSGYATDVLFAGEIWKAADGTIRASRNSGTYRPSEAQLEAVVAYLRAVFPSLRIEKA